MKKPKALTLGFFVHAILYLILFRMLVPIRIVHAFRL